MGRFFQALEPLRAAGKPGAVHFQFAPGVTSGEPGQLVEHCAQVMGDILIEQDRHAGLPISKAVPVVHAVMNNNYEDQGQRNAKTHSILLNAVEPRSEDAGRLFRCISARQ